MWDTAWSTQTNISAGNIFFLITCIIHEVGHRAMGAHNRLAMRASPPGGGQRCHDQDFGASVLTRIDILICRVVIVVTFVFVSVLVVVFSFFFVGVLCALRRLPVCILRGVYWVVLNVSGVCLYVVLRGRVDSVVGGVPFFQSAIFFPASFDGPRAFFD